MRRFNKEDLLALSGVLGYSDKEVVDSIVLLAIKSFDLDKECPVTSTQRKKFIAEHISLLWTSISTKMNMVDIMSEIDEISEFKTWLDLLSFDINLDLLEVLVLLTVLEDTLHIDITPSNESGFISDYKEQLRNRVKS